MHACTFIKDYEKSYSPLFYRLNFWSIFCMIVHVICAISFRCRFRFVLDLSVMLSTVWFHVKFLTWKRNWRGFQFRKKYNVIYTWIELHGDDLVLWPLSYFSYLKFVCENFSWFRVNASENCWERGITLQSIINLNL